MILRSAFMLVVADAAAKGATGILALVIARYLGPDSYGTYATAAALCGLFLMITGAGFELEFTRRAAQQHEVIARAFVLMLACIGIAALVSYLSLAGFLASGVYSSEIILLSLIMALALIVARFHTAFRYLCLILGKNQVTAAFQSLITLALVGLTLAIIYFSGGLAAIVWAQLAVAVAGLILWVWWAPRAYFAARVTGSGIAGFMRNSIFFALSEILWVAYFNFDVFALSLLRPEEVGVYAAVFKLIAITFILAYALANVFTPQLYERYVQARDAYRQTARRLLLAMLATGGVLGAGTFLSAELLIPLVIGDAYVAGVLIAQVLSVAVGLRLVNMALCEILMTADRQRTRVALEAAAVLVNLALNLILIPPYGGVGAGLATVSAEVVLGVSCLTVAKRAALLFEAPGQPARLL